LQFETLLQWQALLFELDQPMSELDFEPANQASERVKSIPGFMDARDNDIKMQRNGIETDFCTKRAAFQDELQKYSEHVEKFKKYGTIRQVDDYIERIETLKEQFAKAESEVEDIVTKEKTLGWDPTDFEMLPKMIEELEPFESLWSLVQESQKLVNSWTKGPLFSSTRRKWRRRPSPCGRTPSSSSRPLPPRSRSSSSRRASPARSRPRWMTSRSTSRSSKRCATPECVSVTGTKSRL
jgi:uncharacterized protein (UPF0335 family)